MFVRVVRILTCFRSMNFRRRAVTECVGYGIENILLGAAEQLGSKVNKLSNRMGAIPSLRNLRKFEKRLNFQDQKHMGRGPRHFA